jgi:hypothetical protein
MLWFIKRHSLTRFAHLDNLGVKVSANLLKLVDIYCIS